MRPVGGTNRRGQGKEQGGDNVRVFQAATENYWYGFPPFTWIVTPVISTVAADYEVGKK